MQEIASDSIRMLMENVHIALHSGPSLRMISRKSPPIGAGPTTRITSPGLHVSKVSNASMIERNQERCRMRGGKPVAQPVQTEIRDRRNVNQNFRHHHEQDGEQQQLSGKADARLPRRPQRILDSNWFAGCVQIHLSRKFVATR